MKTLEAITNEYLDTITGGQAPACTPEQRQVIAKQADRSGGIGAWVGAGLGLAARRNVAVAAATALGGTIIGNEIGSLRGQVQQGCRLP